MNDVKSAFEEALSCYQSMSLGDKYLISRGSRNHLIRAQAWMLKYNGYLFADSHHAARGEGGEYHVYVWAHLLTGEIFYVGSGIDERWLNRYRLTNPGFMLNLDAGDAVVYKIVTDVNRETARFYERYISLALSSCGIALANRDNNVSRCGMDKAKTWLKENADRISNAFTNEVEEVLLEKILSERDFHGTYVLRVMAFREECGSDWFSSGKFINHVDVM